MKKFVALFCAAGLLSGSVFAQGPEQPQVQPEQQQAEEQAEKPALSYKYFNHLGLGISAGIMDGISASLAVPIGDYFQLRAGYSFLSPVYAFEKGFDLSKTISFAGYDLSNVPVKAELTPSFYGFVDLYPSKKHAFHFTLGLFGSSDGNLVNAKADLSKILNKDDWGTVQGTIKNDAGEVLNVSSDEKGFLHASVRANQHIRPYIGIGWGRGANIKHRVSVSFDLGLQYADGARVYVSNYYPGNEGESFLTSSLVDHKDKIDKDVPLIGKQEDIIDQVADGKFAFGILSRFWPVMKLGIHVRLF